MMLPDGAPETGRKGPEAGGQQQETLPGQKNAGEKQQERNQDAGAAPAAGQGQQESGLPPKKNGKGGRAVRRKLLYAAAVVVLLVLVGVKLGFGRGTEQTGEPTLTAVQAQRGDIAVSVSGSGTVQPIEQYDVSSLVSGDILEDYVTLGAQVEAGDLLYVIDSSSAENSIKKARIQLEQQQLSYQQEQESIAALTVRAPIGGVISNLYVQEGDSVNNGALLADIVDTSRMEVTLPFHSADVPGIGVGQQAAVYLEESGDQLAGIVTAKTSGSTVTELGNMVGYVTIEFDNPGVLSEGVSVTAVAGSVACAQAGQASYADSVEVTAGASGTVTGLSLRQGDAAEQGELLFTLENSSLLVSSQSSALSLENAEISLADSYDALNDYNITAPISGTVIQKDYKAGDTLDSNKTSLAVVADMSSLTFTMQIDELDVQELSEGQRVVVTADAVEGKSFDGVITSIGIIGTSSSGVTTYPVEVVIEEYEGLLPGMNVTAEIITEEVTDTVRIPVAALSRGDLVLVTQEYAQQIGAQQAQEEGAAASAQPGEIVTLGTEPQGYVWLKVESGLTDGEYVEITAGLEEGAQVYVSTSAQSGSESTQSGMGMGGMGMGAGMPAGMPSGDMSGGRPQGGPGGF